MARFTGYYCIGIYQPFIYTVSIIHRVTAFCVYKRIVLVVLYMLSPRVDAFTGIPGYGNTPQCRKPYRQMALSVYKRIVLFVDAFAAR